MIDVGDGLLLLGEISSSSAALELRQVELQQACASYLKLLPDETSSHVTSHDSGRPYNCPYQPIGFGIFRPTACIPRSAATNRKQILKFFAPVTFLLYGHY